MDQLPDDVLAMVMSQLDVADVFACRLVCKRLSGVALHPDVWRHRCVFQTDNCACPVLRLAPCLGSLVWLFDSSARHGQSHSPLARCAVQKLMIVVDAAGAREAAQVVRQQRALGRLRAVRLLCVGPKAGAGGRRSSLAMAVLFQTLASTSGLEELKVIGNTGARRSRLRGIVASSLKRFSCCITRETKNFRDYIVARHATTLEDVEFDFDSDYVCPPASSLPRRLAGMPNLRRLSCPLIPGLQFMAASCSLRELKLTVNPSRATGGNACGAMTLLERAVQLRSVHLCIEDDENNYCEVAVLIEGLAMSGRSQVESLTIELQGGPGSTCAPAVQLQLLRALPCLPALRRLNVNMATTELLVGITPTSAPSLRSLQLVEHGDFELTEWMCPNAMLHSDRVREFLSANPLLHVELRCGTCYSCKPCKSGCSYNDSTKYGGTENVSHVCLGIFAHPIDACSSPKDHATNVLWFHISDMIPQIS